jgi:hypothetical protein
VDLQQVLAAVEPPMNVVGVVSYDDRPNLEGEYRGKRGAAEAFNLSDGTDDASYSFLPSVTPSSGHGPKIDPA